MSRTWAATTEVQAYLTHVLDSQNLQNPSKAAPGLLRGACSLRPTGWREHLHMALPEPHVSFPSAHLTVPSSRP